MKNWYEIDWDAYAKTAIRAAAEGAVLLKNDKNALPLREGERISVFGRIQFDYYKSGTGSGGMINTRYVVGILDALKEEKLILNRELEQVYLDWIKEHPYDFGSGWAMEPWCQQEMPLTRGTVERAAAISDVAIVVIGRTAGEDRDIKREAGGYLLTKTEEEMLKKVCAAFERVIVLLNVGSIIDMSWVKTYDPQALLYVWQGGMEGGHGVTEVLMGRVNPCGKLTDTIARSLEDYPSDPDFGGLSGNCYREDIYVGYRYFETFARDKVLYPFGFGLSYTSFVFKSSMTVEKERCIIEISVKNTGHTAGKEVLQVYVCAPQGKLGKPVRELAAFAKTRCLRPGEVEDLYLEVKKDDLASYDDSGVTGYKSCYVLEEGIYRFYVGTDVRSAESVGAMEVKAIEVTRMCREALAPVEEFERIKPVRDKNDRFVILREKAPTRTYSMKERRGREKKREILCSGNLGYRLEDVYDGCVTLEQFIGQLSDQDLCCIVRGEGMCSPKVTPGTAAAFGGITDSLAGYGIPCGCCADGPSGIRMDCGTYGFCLPNGTCLASTFNEKLVEELYELEGAELRKNRIDILLGPGMNIHRHPLNGRNFEYFSEDPLLTGKIAAAQLRGMGKYHVTGALKHFAANNQETNRRTYNSAVSERALREIYLKGFEIAVKETDACAIMTTYGSLNGLWSAGNYDLVTTILREEWKFDGLVMTDWWASINEEGEPASVRNVSAMVKSQNDIYMVAQDAEKNSNKDDLEESLKNGTLTRGDLQRCAANILRVLMRLPVMDRSLKRLSREEEEAFAVVSKEDGAVPDIEWYALDKTLELDGTQIDTRRGNSYVCGLQAEVMNRYKIRIRLKVDALELAQVSLSVFTNGILQRTFTLNGTGGEYVELEQLMEPFFSVNNYLRLYFAESGMRIEKIWLEYTGNDSLGTK